MATVIRASGAEFQEDEPRLERLQRLVGGLLDTVRLPDGRVMFVNDEGLLKGLDFNRKASELVGYPIVGDVVLFTLEETKKDEEA